MSMSFGENYGRRNRNYRDKGGEAGSGIATSHDSPVKEKGRDRDISLSLMEGREAHGK